MSLSIENFLKIIRRAGEAVLEIEKDGDLQVTDKGDNDPLTIADLKANEILSELQKEVPGSFFFSEINFIIFSFNPLGNSSFSIVV